MPNELEPKGQLTDEGLSLARAFRDDIAPYFKMNATEITVRSLPIVVAYAAFNVELALTTALIAAAWKVKAAEEKMHRDVFPEKYLGDAALEQRRSRRLMTGAATLITLAAYGIAPAFFAPANPGGMSDKNDAIIKAAKASVTERVKDRALTSTDKAPYTIKVDGTLTRISPENFSTSTRGNPGSETLAVNATAQFDYPYFFRSRLGGRQTSERELPFSAVLNPRDIQKPFFPKPLP